MPAMGPQYLPISVIAAWRWRTSWSGLACAKALSATTPRATNAPAATMIFFTISSSGVGTPSVNNTGGGTIPLPQPGRVFGYGADFPVGHASGYAAHHAIGIVAARAFLEGFQLG